MKSFLCTMKLHTSGEFLHLALLHQSIYWYVNWWCFNLAETWHASGHTELLQQRLYLSFTFLILIHCWIQSVDVVLPGFVSRSGVSRSVDIHVILKVWAPLWCSELISVAGLCSDSRWHCSFCSGHRRMHWSYSWSQMPHWTGKVLQFFLHRMLLLLVNKSALFALFGFSVTYYCAQWLAKADSEVQEERH